MQNVRKNLRKLHILGGKMHEPVSNEKPTIKSQSFEPNMCLNLERVCATERPIILHCAECEDFKLFYTVEVIENGNLEHRYKCHTCGVILGDENKNELMPTL